MPVSVEHPTDRPNFTIVSTPACRVAFSYNTIVGVYPYQETVSVSSGAYEGFRWWVAVNEWGPTTGKHLNWLDEDKSSRVDRVVVESITAGCFAS